MTELRRKVELRRFRLKRIEDESGVSGTGYVAEGVKFSDGQCVINWLTDTRSIGIYHSPVEMMHIHGHGGKTVIEWVDAESEAGSGAAVEGSGEHAEHTLAKTELEPVDLEIEVTDPVTQAELDTDPNSRNLLS